MTASKRKRIYLKLAKDFFYGVPKFGICSALNEHRVRGYASPGYDSRTEVFIEAYLFTIKDKTVNLLPEEYNSFGPDKADGENMKDAVTESSLEEARMNRSVALLFCAAMCD